MNLPPARAALRPLLLILLLPLAGGCSSTNNYKVASLANDYEYLEARFERDCLAQAPKLGVVPCGRVYDALVEYRQDLTLAESGLKRGGDLSLTVGALKKNRNKAKAELVR